MHNGLLVPDPAKIDAAWMTGALQQSGALHTARITDLACHRVGNGLVADCYRFDLTYGGFEPGVPASVIGKFPASDPASRKSGSEHFLYQREVNFYRVLAPTTAIHTPRAHVAEIDPATDDFTLILADLAPARQGDQLAGCSLADAATAMAQAAALHAPRWGDASLDRLDWLAIRPARLNALVDAALPRIIGLFRDRYDGLLAPGHFALVERLPAAIVAMRKDRSAPRTIVHGDFRLDNIMFDVSGGTAPMATLDWQTVGVGAGLTDVAYFLSAALDPADRRRHEDDLVHVYHDALCRRGVHDYDWAQCWRDYRRHTLHGILMGVFSALSVERTVRGDELFLKMTRGACQQAEDHDSFACWI